jgi:hypothetical protein
MGEDQDRAIALFHLLQDALPENEKACVVAQAALLLHLEATEYVSDQNRPAFIESWEWIRRYHEAGMPVEQINDEMLKERSPEEEQKLSLFGRMWILTGRTLTGTLIKKPATPHINSLMRSIASTLRLLEQRRVSTTTFLTCGLIPPRFSYTRIGAVS